MNRGGKAAVTIGVVTYNAPAALKRCLSAILKHTTDVPYRLALVDNGSSNANTPLIRALSRRRRVWHRSYGRNLGKAAAMNRIVSENPSSWYVFLDDDVVVGENWLSRMLDHALSHPAAPRIIGCQSLLPDGTVFCAEQSPNATAIGEGERDCGQRDYIRLCDILCGACLLVGAEVFGRGVRFDEAFYPCQYEDADFCLQSRSLGFRALYVGSVKVRHDHLFRQAGKYRLQRRRLESKWKVPVLFRDSHPLDRALAAIEVALRQNRDAEVVRLCRASLRLHPVAADAHWPAAIASAALGRWPQAVAGFSRVLEDARLAPKLRAQAWLLRDQALWNRRRG